MPLLYPIKIKFEEGVIISLFSPDLKVDFFNMYNDPNVYPPVIMEKLETSRLKSVIENYIKWVEDNNFILRIPSDIEFNFLQQDSDYSANIKIDMPIRKGLFEQSGKIIAVSLYLINFLLGVFIDVLAARLNNISYTTLIFPVLANFALGSIFYKYSGASSNIVELGRNIDNFLSCKTISPEELKVEIEKPFCSSFKISKIMLSTLAISNVIFQTLGYWQGMISMGNQFKASNLHDPIITSKSIFIIADITAITALIYEGALTTSFALKAVNPLQNIIDKLYGFYLKNVYVFFCHRSYGFVAQNEIELLSDLSDNLRSSDASDHHITSSFSENQELEQNLSVFFITHVEYKNKLLNDYNLVQKVIKMGGPSLLNKIINLGEDSEVANTIIEYIEHYGVENVMKILFYDSIKNYKIEVDLPHDQFITLSSKNSKKSITPDVEKIIDRIIEENFFLNNEKGREFIETILNNFDENTLITVLELGRDQDIAEQIVSEAEVQGVERVVYTLLGKEPPVIGTTDNLENILSQDELNQLKLIPNGILNSWSNKAYQSIAYYIDNLAKSLDDMLNMGKSGTSVAITIALLEEWLGFAASGQRFLGGVPSSYYNPNNDDVWSNGGGGSGSYGGNNSSENNSNGFTGLILPLHNGTDYNITDYQM